MRQIVKSQWFALFDLLLVIMSGTVWMLKPEIGLWSTLIAMIPWILRIVSGVFPFRRTSFDWLIAIFLVTAWVGYWAAYDKTAAWSKFWLIVVAVLLYYSLVVQPKENLIWISGILFCLGVGISVYFFLTHDFVSLPRKLGFVNGVGRWIMENRPQLGWMPIHPNYAAGVIAITTPFVFYPVWKLSKNIKPVVVLLYVIVAIVLGVSLFGFVMATSRGAIMAVASAAGVWLLWRIVNLSGIRFRLGHEAVFPSLLLLYLVVIVVFLYMGPARSGSSISGQDHFGTGSRAELFSRSVYFLADFPFTGGGLGSFPGLYSQYVLIVPFYYVPNSHNIFLDVFIEQGMFGGLAFFLVYVGGIWIIACITTRSQSFENRVFSWLSLFALIIAFVHGMVDDYLYYKNGTMLALFLVGISASVSDDKVLVDEKMGKPFFKRYRMISISLIAFVFLSVCVVNLNKIRSAWHANLGAVEMAKVELAGFPANEWAGAKHDAELVSAEESLLSSLQFDTLNRTANYRLGLISMSRRDFSSALDYLLEAYRQAPQHHGIVKSLGYCYVWMGDIDNAGLLLKNIPEAKSELNVYIWWWDAQGRSDLSTKAAIMSSMPEALLDQP